jgi:predicted AAA+ superfamily ATPase
MILRACKPLKTKSFFLLGARATGKSTLLRDLFSPNEALWFDLLEPELEAEFQTRPLSILERLEPKRKQSNVQWVIVDEVQKAPKLLDPIHQEIERKRFKFALTGSSARKIRRGAANLLGGRALQNYLFPFTRQELGKSFDLDSALNWGTLPEIHTLDPLTRGETLKSYCNTYLKEEVVAEQLVRKVAPFRSFLEVAGQSSGTTLNLSKIARDIGSDPVSVKSYFEILEDTLLGFHLPAYHSSIRKRLRKSPKFYLFDPGVARALRKRINAPLLKPGTSEYGRAFEHWVILEVFRLNHYRRADYTLSYLSTKDDVEVDLVVERPGMPLALVEIKSTDKVTRDHVRQVAVFRKELPNSLTLCLSRDPVARTIDGVECLPWEQGIERLF